MTQDKNVVNRSTNVEFYPRSDLCGCEERCKAVLGVPVDSAAPESTMTDDDGRLMKHPRRHRYILCRGRIWNPVRA
jgi:hypothetical protein